MTETNTFNEVIETDWLSKATKEEHTPLEIAARNMLTCLGSTSDIGWIKMGAAAKLEAALEDQLDWKAMSLAVDPVKEITGNVAEGELAARYMEAKASAALAVAARKIEVGDQYELVSHAFNACAGDFRAKLHLPALVVGGSVIGYNQDDGSATAKHAASILLLVTDIHQRNVKAGWWHDITTGEPLERNVGELLCLCHSELSEAMEGHRKGLMDTHLTQRSMIEVELADCVIRIADMAGGLGLDLGGAIDEKLAYNAKRADHKIENRLQADGKKY